MTPRPRGGFTLVELLLVVALMMLAAAAVATNLDAVLPGTRLEATARMLGSDIAAARSSAIAQGLPYRLEYDLEHATYRIATPFKAGGGVAAEEDERVASNWKEFPEGVKIRELLAGNRSITGGTYRIEFLPNGNTVEHVICLERDIPPGKFYLAVQGLTGFVQFYGDDWSPDRVSDSDFR